jgi:hypothetical protein
MVELSVVSALLHSMTEFDSEEKHLLRESAAVNATTA